MTKIKLEQIKTFNPVEGFRAKITHTNNQTLAFWEIDAGAALPEHSHMHEQVAIITKGELELTVNGVAHVLKEGEMYAIPSNAPHSAKALTYCEMTDVFYPVREDLQDY